MGAVERRRTKGGWGEEEGVEKEVRCRRGREWGERGAEAGGGW